MCRIPMPDEARQVVGLLEAAGFEAYIVGGCVRDGIMGRTPNDFDVTTSAKPDEVKAVMHAAGIETADTGVKYGTVTVIVGGQAFETTTFRSDGPYSDGRHPDSVELLESIEGDLARRDFTVNAMAYNPRKGVVDLHRGREDLEARVIRSVGDAHTRFSEDALRILRGLRFAASFEFEIAPETAAAMHADRELLHQVSAERISQEFLKLVCAPGAFAILVEFADVIAAVVPQIAPSIGFDQRNSHHAYTVWEHCVRACCAAPRDDVAMRLAALFHDIGKPACFFMGEDGEGHFYGHRDVSADLFEEISEELKLPRKLSDEVGVLVRYHDANIPTTPAGWRRWALKFGEDGVRRIMQLHRYDVSALAPGEVEGGLRSIERASEDFEAAIEEVHVTGTKDLEVDGRDLLMLGVEQGPLVGQILRELLDEVAEGTLPNERGALLGRAEELAREPPREGA